MIGGFLICGDNPKTAVGAVVRRSRIRSLIRFRNRYLKLHSWLRPASYRFVRPGRLPNRSPAVGLAPQEDAESAILVTLEPGASQRFGVWRGMPKWVTDCLKSAISISRHNTRGRWTGQTRRDNATLQVESITSYNICHMKSAML